MIRSLMNAAAVLSLVTVAAAPLAAAPCRDAKGKFVKCPQAAPTAGARCKDSKGKFAKCGTPGAMPAAKK